MPQNHAFLFADQLIFVIVLEINDGNCFFFVTNVITSISIKMDGKIQNPLTKSRILGGLFCGSLMEKISPEMTCAF